MCKIIKWAKCEWTSQTLNKKVLNIFKIFSPETFVLTNINYNINNNIVSGDRRDMDPAPLTVWTRGWTWWRRGCCRLARTGSGTGWPSSSRPSGCSSGRGSAPGSHRTTRAPTPGAPTQIFLHDQNLFLDLLEMHFIFIFEKTDKSILLKWSDLGICFRDGD